MAMFLFYALVVDARSKDWTGFIAFTRRGGFSVMQTMIREKLFYTLNSGRLRQATLCRSCCSARCKLLRQRVPDWFAGA